MDLASGIRKIGFRRWYERQLITSHLYLAAALLCMVVALAAIEEFSPQAPGWERLKLLALIVGGLAGCLFSLERYRRMLLGAQHAADRSTCAACSTYGVLELVRSGVTHADALPHAKPVPWVRVRCRKCGNEWTIE